MKRIVIAILAMMPAVASAELVGFKNLRLDQNSWEVRYVGNAFMSELSVRKRLLCNTGKLGQKNGYSYMAFQSMDQHSQSGPTMLIANPMGQNGAIVTGAQVSYFVSVGQVVFANAPQVEGQQPIATMMGWWEC